MTITLDGTSGITTPTYGGNVTAEYQVPVTGFKNRIINGAMVINQRNYGSTPISTDPVFTLDRWRNSANGGGAFSSVQSTTVPSSATFTNSICLTVTTPDASVASSDYYLINQVIEGLNMADFGFGTAAAKPITVSFWVRSSIAGQYGFCFSNRYPNDRAYVAMYTIASPNTWQYVTITIPGCTDGTWNTDNTTGAFAIWTLSDGSGRQTATPNTWLTTFAESTSAQTNWIGTNGATFYLTGVQIEKGSTATSFDYRPYGTELTLCQRYCVGADSYQFSSGMAGATVGAWLRTLYPVNMRATPSCSVTAGTITISDDYAADYTAASPVISSYSAGTVGGRAYITGFSGLTIARYYAGVGGTATIIWNAEL